MPRKRIKKEGVSFGWLRMVAMALCFYLGVSFFINIIEAFLEGAGGISEEGLIFGLTPLRFYIVCLFLLVCGFAILAGSYQNARKEIMEKLD